MADKLCLQCQGTGYIWVTLMTSTGDPEDNKDTCPTCQGKGMVKE